MKNNINIGISVVDLSIGKTVVYETYSKTDDKNYSLDETYDLYSCMILKKLLSILVVI